MPIVFGDFTLDKSRRQLLRAGEPVHLSPKAFQLLSILVEASPAAVSKADLQDRLWPGTFVTEGSLATLVTELRSSLGDAARERRFIRTLYGFGYSFAAALQEAGVSQPTSPPKRRLGHLTSAAAFGAIAVTLILASRSTTGSAPPLRSPSSIRSIAVLPFDTTGADRADEHLGLGLPDLLITRLSNVREVTVRPTSTIREFEGRHNDGLDIGRKLKVDAVLEGSVRTSPDRVRVTVQLLNIHDNRPMWADRFDEKRADIFTIEDSISAKLTEALRLQLTTDEKMQLGKRYTSNPDAYQSYVQGRYHLQLAGARSYEDEPERAVEFFQKAVEKDPRFAAAWAGMSTAYVWGTILGRFAAPSGWISCRDAARKAVDLDPTLAEGYAGLAVVKAHYDLDYAGAQQLYEHALEINPREDHALVGSAVLLQALGQFDQAIAFRKRLIEIDPVSASAQWGLANAYLTSGQIDLAAKQVEAVLGMDPNFSEAHIALIRIHIARGEFNQAIAVARKQAENPQNTRALAFLGYSLARAGRREEARAVLHQVMERSAKSTQTDYFGPAIIDAGLGDVDSMMPLLEKGVHDRAYTLRLKTEPIFLPFHSDPRFIALLKRAGFRS
jgi:TolB-like protein/DNA-binding winged helix-turn-helix (wHTH) protein/Tfp pilus assembly protein PilF